jgi:hypothetical protein
MSSAFSHLADLIDRARKADGAPRQTQQDREAERRDREARRQQSREDIAFGRRSFLEQQSKQAAEADSEAQYEAFCKAQALKIIQAGARARGLPVPTRLIQGDPFQPFLDQEQSPEYPDDPNYHDPGKDPSEGDDSPVDDKDHKTKKKTVKKKVQDEGDEEADSGEPKEPDTTPNPPKGESPEEYRARCAATALAIVNSGRRRRGLPLLSKLD